MTTSDKVNLQQIDTIRNHHAAFLAAQHKIESEAIEQLAGRLHLTVATVREYWSRLPA